MVGWMRLSMVPFLWILRHGFTVQELCNINKLNKKDRKSVV